jgi:hypothetical protein
MGAKFGKKGNGCNAEKFRERQGRSGKDEG